MTNRTDRRVCSQISKGEFYKFTLTGHYLAQKNPGQPPQLKSEVLARKRVATSGAGKWSGQDPDEASCRWTPWLNRDAPGGVGDFETLRDHHAAGNACAAPRGVECRPRSGQEAGESQPFTCDPDVGGVCDNRKLDGGRGCLDYEVRFCC